MRIRLTAYEYEENGSFIITCGLFSPKGRVEIDAIDFADADAKVRAFGDLHAPCNVWIGFAGPRGSRKPRGFDAWCGTDHLFPQRDMAAEYVRELTSLGPDDDTPEADAAQYVAEGR